MALSVAALIWSQNPLLTAEEVKQRLFDSAEDIDGLSCNSSYNGQLGAGRVNAFKAVAACENDLAGDGDVELSHELAHVVEAGGARGVRFPLPPGALQDDGDQDLVFGGDRAFSDERTGTGPLGVYGRTKREGEEALLASDPTAAVIRVALVAGRGHGARGTVSEGVAWALQMGRTVRLFADEYRTPVDRMIPV